MNFSAPFSNRQHRERLIGFIFFAVPALLYFLTRSRWLDEWDSVQFALGVRSFNLFEHTPHPPGYPLYVFSGWVFVHVFRLAIPSALVAVSCLCGGVFVAAWHSIFRRCFRPALAAVAAASIALVPMTWMTATKALTDIPSAAMLALTLALALRARAPKSTDLRWLAGAALAGAAAAGFRPQNFAIALVVLIVGVMASRKLQQTKNHKPQTKSHLLLLTLLLFLAGCLLWVIPTLWTQSRLPEAHGNWLAWPHQIVMQWRWRLDKPGVYVGAASWNFRYFVERLGKHFVAAFLLRGVAFKTSGFAGLTGWSVLALGWGLYLARRVFRRPGHRIFWRLCLPWAVPYIIMIFTCLPEDVRYYTPIMPLALLPAAAGWWSLGRRWGQAAWALPLLLLATALPLARQGHREPPPPVRLIETVLKRHPAAERREIWVYFTSSVRHLNWYAPELRQGSTNSKKYPERAVAIYTEDPELLKKTGWTGMRIRKLKTFTRPGAIYNKHHSVTLYKVYKIPAGNK